MSSPPCTLVNLKASQKLDKSMKHTASKYTVDDFSEVVKIGDKNSDEKNEAFQLNISELSAKKKQQNRNATCCGFINFRKKFEDFFNS